jgi:alpha-beta hydrolase superfamily lysophospholipase
LPSTTTIESFATDQTQLRGEIARPDGPARAVVVLAHGKDEHFGRYRHVIAALIDAGFAVYAHDHRGHGRSDGPRGVIVRFDDYVDDLALLVDRARADHPELPIYLLGHSMGGLIATRYALGHQGALAGLILSGPALLIAADEPAWKKQLLVHIGRLLPNARISTSKPGYLSRDPEVERAFAADPLCNNQRTRLGFVRALYLASEDTRPRARELSLPLLIMHGDADRLASPNGSVELFNHASSADKTLQLWPDNRHEIFNDLDSAAVLAFMMDWLLERNDENQRALPRYRLR